MLLSGDHVLGDITPNITVWREEDDSLGDYLESLDKVAQLEVDLVLPGHRTSFTDCRGRIAELKEHHRNRLDEVLAILDGGGRTVYEIASKMTWDIKAKTWGDFPVVQKWFAVSEAAAHLRHLEIRGEVSQNASGESFIFDAV
jgi:glyoxylase-like metal-dependent hydrolase (beta-lactamase superfamily II)